MTRSTVNSDYVQHQLARALARCILTSNSNCFSDLILFKEVLDRGCIQHSDALRMSGTCRTKRDQPVPLIPLE